MPGWAYIVLCSLAAGGVNNLAFAGMKGRHVTAALTALGGIIAGCILIQTGFPASLSALAGFALGIAAGVSILDLTEGVVADIQSFAIAASGVGASLLLALPGQTLLEAALLSLGGGALAAGILWGVGAWFHWRRGIRGLGDGDVWLAGAAGCWAGLMLIGPAFLVACIAAILLALATGRLKARIPFAPGLMIGFAAAAVLRISIWSGFTV